MSWPDQSWASALRASSLGALIGLGSALAACGRVLRRVRSALWLWGGLFDGGTRGLTVPLWYANFMADYAKRDYGRCPCSGTYDNRFVEVRLTVNGKVVVLTDVPQGACPNCGSRVYKAEVLERIESLMKGQKVRKVQ
jgi:YgiT-type zinc finger domain-containing protein